MTHQYEKLMAEARSAVWIGSDGHPTIDWRLLDRWVSVGYAMCAICEKVS